MRIIATPNFLKSAANFDDQPNFYSPRYKRNQGEVLFSDDGFDDNTDDIKKQWSKKKKRKKKHKDEWPDISME
jgi:glycosyltransferase involved in cell wall biosynthesis